MPNSEALKLGLKLVEEAAKVRTYDEDMDGIVGEEWFETAPPQQGWHQGSWIKFGHLSEGFCLTAGCFAGHIAIHDGFTEPVVNRVGDAVLGIRNAAGEELVFNGEGANSVAGYARRALGLDYTQAESLFAATNTLDDLRGIVDRLCQE